MTDITLTDKALKHLLLLLMNVKLDLTATQMALEEQGGLDPALVAKHRAWLRVRDKELFDRLDEKPLDALLEC